MARAHDCLAGFEGRSENTKDGESRRWRPPNGRVRPPRRAVVNPQKVIDSALKSVQTEIGLEEPGAIAAKPTPEKQPDQSRPEASASTADDAAGHGKRRGHSPLLDKELTAAIAQCAEGKPSFFAGLHQTAQALAPTYALLALMLAGGAPVIDAVVSHPSFPSRERAPRRDNPALIAILLAAKPENERQRKWCSEWANVLIEADHAGIQPEIFGQWAAGITLKECKAEVRKRRRGRNVKAPKHTGGEAAGPAEKPVVEALDLLPVTTGEPAPRLEVRLVARQADVTLSFGITESVYRKMLLALHKQSPEISMSDALSKALNVLSVADQTSTTPFPKVEVSLSDRGQAFARQLRQSVQKLEQRCTSDAVRTQPLKHITTHKEPKPIPQRRPTGAISKPRSRKPILFQNRPPYTRPKRKSPPEIIDLRAYKETHRWADERKKTYLEIDRRGGQQLALGVCRELETGRLGRFAPIDLLYANNAESRINLAEIAVRHVRAHEALGGSGRIFFVTITPEQFATPERDAASFDPQTIQAWTRQMLGGFDFIGMVEAALFPAGRDETDSSRWWQERRPMISWHVHLLVWNTSYWRLNKVLARIRRQHPSFVTGTPSARCRTLDSAADVTHRTLYMLKAPQKQYRVFRNPLKEVHDPATGEIVAKPYVQKDWLRTGQRVRMCRVMADK